MLNKNTAVAAREWCRAMRGLRPWSARCPLIRSIPDGGAQSVNQSRRKALCLCRACVCVCVLHLHFLRPHPMGAKSRRHLWRMLQRHLQRFRKTSPTQGAASSHTAAAPIPEVAGPQDGPSARSAASVGIPGRLRPAASQPRTTPPPSPAGPRAVSAPSPPPGDGPSTAAAADSAAATAPVDEGT